MAFTYQITADPNVSQTLIADANYALQRWSNALNTVSNAHGDIVIKLEVAPVEGIPRGLGGTTLGTATALTQHVGNGERYAYGPPGWPTSPVTITSLSEALQGHGQNYTGVLYGTGADAIIRIDPTFLANQVYQDPTPTTSNDIPSNKVDAVSVIEHEFLHALGMTGYFPYNADDTTDLTANFNNPILTSTAFDKWIRFENGLPVFVGPNAKAANGGQSVQLGHHSSISVGETLYHLDHDAYPSDLMNGTYVALGQRYAISTLDVGIAKDILAVVPYGVVPPNPLGSSPTLANPPPKFGFPEPKLAYPAPQLQMLPGSIDPNDLLPSVTSSVSGHCGVGRMDDHVGGSMRADLMIDQPNWLADFARAA